MNLRNRTLLFAGLLAPVLMLTACEPATVPPDETVAAAPEATEASPECVRTPPAEPMVCTMEWRPVCGCDDITYPNACGARAAGITVFEEGACEADRLE